VKIKLCLNADEVSFDDWLVFLFFNRSIFTKLIVSLILLVCIPSYLSWVCVGTAGGIFFGALAMCLSITFFGVLRYRYWLDIAEHPSYWDEMLAYSQKKMEEREHADAQ
jgi:hypothetical protein